MLADSSRLHNVDQEPCLPESSHQCRNRRTGGQNLGEEASSRRLGSTMAAGRGDHHDGTIKLPSVILADPRSCPTLRASDTTSFTTSYPERGHQHPDQQRARWS
jgi:hypothetical protein